LSAWRSRTCGIVAGIAVSLAAGACGGGQTRPAGESTGRFPVAVTTASFPARQRLAQPSQLVLAVRNAGTRAIPDVAVTICNVTCAYPAPAGEGTSAQPFAQDIRQQDLANPSRPIWTVDRSPGACTASCGAGAQGGDAVTAYDNTWALGRLAPGHTARFVWSVTAVAPGRHVVAWEVAAGVAGRARAVTRDGSLPHGTFAVTISSAPARETVEGDGQVVTDGG
jgi:hypothetical protein